MPRVVLADDHEIVRRGIAALISSKEGWEIVGEASNGHQAREIMRMTRPDLAVFDYSLPPTNGADVLRDCLVDQPGLPVLIYTMHEDDAVILRSLQAGTWAVLQKGEDAALLEEALESLAAGEPYLRGRVSEMALRGLVDRNLVNQEAPSPRELEVLTNLAKGFSGKEVAQILQISPKTVEIHRSAVMRKLKLRNLVDLVHYAIRNHLIDP